MARRPTASRKTTKPRRVEAPTPRPSLPGLPYHCTDPLLETPVRLRLCRPDPRKPPRQKCAMETVAVVACATPSADRPHRRMLYVVREGSRFVIGKREVEEAMRAEDARRREAGGVDCEDARRRHEGGRAVSEDELDACGLSDGSDAGLTFDPDAFDFGAMENGYRRARGGVRTRRNAKHRSGKRGGAPRGSVIDDDAGDPLLHRRVFGPDFSGVIRGVVVPCHGSERSYLVGGEAVPRSRVVAALRRRERDHGLRAPRPKVPGGKRKR